MSAKIACAGPTDIDDMFIGGASESFWGYLNDPTDGTSSSLYSNYVRVQVNGVGIVDLPNGPNDPFYYWNNPLAGTPLASPYDLHLGLGTGTSNVDGGGQQILNSIAFVNGVGWTSARPAWEGFHAFTIYDFVIDVGATDRQLTLGTGDPLFTDNELRIWNGGATNKIGHYEYTLTALTVVPEPISSTLFLVGSGFLGVCYHRKKKMRASA